MNLSSLLVLFRFLSQIKICYASVVLASYTYIVVATVLYIYQLIDSLEHFVFPETHRSAQRYVLIVIVNLLANSIRPGPVMETLVACLQTL